MTVHLSLHPNFAHRIETYHGAAPQKTASTQEQTLYCVDSDIPPGFHVKKLGPRVWRHAYLITTLSKGWTQPKRH